MKTIDIEQTEPAVTVLAQPLSVQLGTLADKDCYSTIAGTLMMLIVDDPSTSKAVLEFEKTSQILANEGL